MSDIASRNEALMELAGQANAALEPPSTPPGSAAPFKPGDRVYVTCPGLASLRHIMRLATGQEPPPNHHGTVSDEPWDEPGTVLIDFDDGGGAPYAIHEVRRLTEGDADAR